MNLRYYTLPCMRPLIRCLIKDLYWICIDDVHKHETNLT